MFKKRAKQNYRIGGGWGNAINWFPSDQFEGKEINDKSKFCVVGWKPRIPEKGDILQGDFERSVITFEFVKIERCYDPIDMFFADVRPIGQVMKLGSAVNAKQTISSSLSK